MKQKQDTENADCNGKCRAELKLKVSKVVQLTGFLKNALLVKYSTFWRAYFCPFFPQIAKSC